MEADLRWHRRANRTLQRRNLKAQAVAAMGGHCRICGYNRCLSALTFHHLDPLEKDFSISTKQSWSEVERELRKCVLLCSNCHQEVHDGMHPRYLVTEEAERAWGPLWDDGEFEPPEEAPSGTDVPAL